MEMICAGRQDKMTRAHAAGGWLFDLLDGSRSLADWFNHP